MRPIILTLALLGLAACETPIVSTATNVGLAAATVASPTLAPVTGTMLAARMASPGQTGGQTDSATPEPTLASVTTPPVQTASTEAGLVTLVNSFRTAEGKTALTANPALNAAALAHAFDMSQNGFAGHTGSDGSTVGTRARAAGCNWSSVSQNITVGQSDPAAALLAWVNAPAQRRNLLGTYTDFGEARVGDVWVAVFALGC